MRLTDVFRPVPVDDLKVTYFGRQCLLVRRRKTNPFEGMLTLDQLETRLNDGVGTLSALSIIQPDGTKLPPGEVITQQPGRAWASFFLQKGRVRGLLEEGCSFVMHNMSALTPAIEELVRDIEGAFPGVHADVHVYVSPRAGATGYNAHQDRPQHKIYLQLLGSTRWTVFQKGDERTAMPVDEARETLGVEFEAELTPGSALYMPPGVFHHATNPDTPRVSLSIPFYAPDGCVQIDRTPIPLKAMFESGS